MGIKKENSNLKSITTSAQNIINTATEIIIIIIRPPKEKGDPQKKVTLPSKSFSKCPVVAIHTGSAASLAAFAALAAATASFTGTA